MLNTESKLVSLIIWLTIGAICAEGLWTAFTWPSPQALLSRLLESELATFTQRNQTIVSSLLGFGGLAIAYVLSAWRDRVERRHVFERAERRDGSVLSHEARELRDTCERAAHQLAQRNPAVSSIKAELEASLAIGNHMLLAAQPIELARLGAGASAAARAVRVGVARLNNALATIGRDDASSAHALAARAVETALAAERALRIFETLATHGLNAADRVPLPATPDQAEIDWRLSQSDEPRLLPAA